MVEEMVFDPTKTLGSDQAMAEAAAQDAMRPATSVDQGSVWRAWRIDKSTGRENTREASVSCMFRRGRG